MYRSIIWDPEDRRAERLSEILGFFFHDSESFLVAEISVAIAKPRGANLEGPSCRILGIGDVLNYGASVRYQREVSIESGEVLEIILNMSFGLYPRQLTGCPDRT
jgi:hypothetical protein